MECSDKQVFYQFRIMVMLHPIKTQLHVTQSSIILWFKSDVERMGVSHLYALQRIVPTALHVYNMQP